MSHVPHELHEEFPYDGDVLHRLKVSMPEFRDLSADYHEINREIHRVETDIEPASDQVLSTLKKRRLGMLDAMKQMILKAKAATA